VVTRLAVTRWLAAAATALVVCAAAFDVGCAAILNVESAQLDPCVAYCDAIGRNCTGPNLEYLTQAVCLQVCGVWDVGTSGDSTGNTVECRLTHAQAAASDPATECPKAGLIGGRVCGDDPCGSFCLLDTQLCGTQGYDGGTDCQNSCAGAPPAVEGGPPGFDYVLTASGDLQNHSGDDTLNCRAYHLENALNAAEVPAATALATHCPHTRVVSLTCTAPPVVSGDP
jgi:hypothetical protein